MYSRIESIVLDDLICLEFGSETPVLTMQDLVQKISNPLVPNNVSALVKCGLLQVSGKQDFVAEGICTELPHSWDENTSYDVVHDTLKNWQPARTDKDGVVRQTKLLLTLVEYISGRERKATISRYLFQLLAANKWFMDTNEPFRVTVQNKISEFEHNSIQEANDIAVEFAWLNQYPFAEPDLFSLTDSGILRRDQTRVLCMEIDDDTINEFFGIEIDKIDKDTVN